LKTAFEELVTALGEIAKEKPEKVKEVFAQVVDKLAPSVPTVEVEPQVLRFLKLFFTFTNIQFRRRGFIPSNASNDLAIVVGMRQGCCLGTQRIGQLLKQCINV